MPQKLLDVPLQLEINKNLKSIQGSTIQLISNLMLASTESQVNSLFLVHSIDLQISLLMCLITVLTCSKFSWFLISSPVCI